MKRFLAYALMFALLSPAYAAPPPAEMTYYVVDVSGSMRPRDGSDPLLEARAILESEIGAMTKGQWAAVAFFGLSSDGSKVGEPCSMTELSALYAFQGVESIPNFPPLGGSEINTSIGAALESILSQASDTAKVVLITDGGEECDSDFVSLRANHPYVTFDVRQVSDDPNPALDQLETLLSAPPDLPKVEPPEVQLVELASPVHIAATANDAWVSAGPYERKLWLLGLLALAFSAWFLGSSFGKKANRYEGATRLIERTRREILSRGETSEEKIEQQIPAELTDEEVQHEGKIDSWRSAIAMFVAGVLGLPLIFWGAAYPPTATPIATVVVGLILLGALVFCIVRWTKKHSSATESLFKSDISNPSFWITVCVFVVGCILSWSAFLVDPSKASAAAWYVLSTNFSAALSITASAPLLFVGSKWWQFESAKTTYRHTYTEAISDSLREKRRQEKLAHQDWMNHRLLQMAWRPSLGFSLIGRAWSRFGSERVNDAQEIIVTRLKEITQESVGNEYSIERATLLQQLNETTALEERVRVLLESEITKNLMEPREEWVQFVDALTKAKIEKLRTKRDSQIAAALTRLSKVINRRTVDLA